MSYSAQARGETKKAATMKGETVLRLCLIQDESKTPSQDISLHLTNKEAVIIVIEVHSASTPPTFTTSSKSQERSPADRDSFTSNLNRKRTASRNCKMAPNTRRNSALMRKIATLQLRLAPLVPLPSGPAHPAFPKTIMAFHLLTEDELDSIAHHYHQSTPGPWTDHYPANMNWDKDFLAKRRSQANSPTKQRHSRRLSQEDKVWLEDLLKTVEDLQAPMVPSLNTPTFGALEEFNSNGPNPYANLSDKDRIRIKRRKVGKFIGFLGMDTPLEEISGRIQASLDRAIERSRAEMRQNEEIMLRRRKMV